MAAGRNRSFDKDKALETAMHLYWQNGYANTSLADLTQAIGINKPSLYAAFGNKEQLFITALQQYAHQHVLPTLEHLHASDQSLEQRLRTYFQSVAQLFCQPNLPAGCFVANSTCELAGKGMPEVAQQLLATLNQATKQKMTDFFTQEQAQGNLKSESSPLVMALFLMATNSGLAVLARSGTPLDELNAMIEHAVQTFV